MDAMALPDEQRGRGRRSRVVLASRRWGQVARARSARRWEQESPVPRESTKDTVKTVAQGRPGCLGQTCGNCRLLFLLQAGHGRGQRPAFPAPSRSQRAANDAKLGHQAPRERETMSADLTL